MKLLLSIVLTACLTTFSFAQRTFIQNGKLNGIVPVDTTGKITFRHVEIAEGVSKVDIFKRARKWFLKTYNQPKDLLEVNDATTGEVSGKGTLSFVESTGLYNQTYNVYHVVSIDAAEGKYRVTLSSFTVQGTSYIFPAEKFPYVSQKFLDRFYGNIDKKVNERLSSLKKAVTTADNFD
ncbi:DUF4468 domain-containing protein [Spirosoma spitsbergense]|uniref:DUF4468 domain-containing protein n=1 Tax=Spirosoma spitsbergense TaxID=431554 RepID=UPI00036E6D8F|nr:DUF4468 domain-containing protein [Spirosoma spitsbergense]